MRWPLPDPLTRLLHIGRVLARDAVDDVTEAIERQRGAWADERADHNAELARRTRALLPPAVSPDTAEARRVHRLAAALNAARPGADLDAVLLASDDLQAFAMYGQEVFVTLGLVRALASDDALAFVLAHEMAHIDLGHVRVDGELVDALPELPTAAPGLRTVVGLTIRHWVSPEVELEADWHGAELCMRAGLRPDGYLETFAVLARARDAELPERADADPDAFLGWLTRRATGYPPLEERRDRLRRGRLPHRKRPSLRRDL